MEVEKSEIITLSDNREYVCLDIITTNDGKKYLYLMTTSEPLNFCFAEEAIVDNSIQMRIIGSKDEKHRLFDLFKAQSQTNSSRGL